MSSKLARKAGLGYSFLNPKLLDYRRLQDPTRANFDEFSGDIADIMQPLVHQPGEGFEYGVRAPA